jgi:hydrogenase maturation protease
MEKKILVAGVGNLLLTDEGIGVHVVRALARERLPGYVLAADVGTAILDLLTLIEGKEKVIIVDAIMSQAAPGTVYRLTPEDLKTGRRRMLTSMHEFGVKEALDHAALLGATPEVVIFGVVPEDYRTPGLEPTNEVRAVIPRIVQAILSEIGPPSSPPETRPAQNP